jgi:hypothetical protein
MSTVSLSNKLSTNQRKTITQFIHNWLPVNGHPGRAQIKQNQICPVCNIHQETQTHFMTCDNTRDKWVTILNEHGLNTPGELDENTHLNRILHWAIINYSDVHYTYPTSNVPQQYHHLINTQQELGWNQIILGRWSREWSVLFNPHDYKQGQKLAIRKLTLVWKAMLQLWHYRCDKQHEDSNKQNNQIRLQLTPKVNAIYTQKIHLDHVDRRVLESTITSTLQLPLIKFQDWIRRTEAFVKQGLARTRRRTKAQNHAITSFFQPRQPQNSQQHERHATSQTEISNTTSTTHTPPNPTNNENEKPP